MSEDKTDPTEGEPMDEVVEGPDSEQDPGNYYYITYVTGSVIGWIIQGVIGDPFSLEGRLALIDEVTKLAFPDQAPEDHEKVTVLSVEKLVDG